MTVPGESRAWLPFLEKAVPESVKTPIEAARFELSAALAQEEVFLVSRPQMDEGFSIDRTAGHWRITGGNSGLLYGAYRLITALRCGEEPDGLSDSPCYPLRMINCWDNLDGSIERGYSGRSLFFNGGKISYDPARLRQLARLLASAGLNVICLNNVNVHEPAQMLIEEEWLPEVKRIADLFRAFGVRLMLSVDFTQPMLHGVPTADPLNSRVAEWWKNQAEIVYRYIPDLAGFLVKADSEHRAGPFAYGRTHAEGANMLARALRPFGGRLIWRCFVYNCQQDWRDRKTDRPMAAYQHYAPLDGQFDENVILQVKNGPFDFQVREPVSPLFYAMPNTHLAVEFQLAQEYTGHQIDLYAMQGMWREFFDACPAEKCDAIAAVGNLGNDAFLTGHPFAALNLLGFGMLSWHPKLRPEECVRRWCRLTYALPKAEEDTLTKLLLSSREIYEQYTSPLGLCWMVSPGVHYGPSPDGYEFSPWGTYHKADREAVGIDRTTHGTGYAAQYPEPWRSLYESRETCPEKLLLFFHRVKYHEKMRDGRTLIQRIYDDHFEGCERTEKMAEALKTLSLPKADRKIVLERMASQLQNAREWRDVINTFFYRLSGVKDERGRTIYE